MMGLIFALNLVPAWAYEVVDDRRAAGDGPAIGACGAPLPANISRRARDHRLVCGGAVVRLPVRTAIKSPHYEEWSRLERSDPAGSRDTQRQMQVIRLREDPIRYTGSTQIKTYETWVTSVRLRGANPKRCHVWQRPYVHRYVVKDPIYDRRCHWSSGSSSRRHHEHGHGGGSSHHGPRLGPKMDTRRMPKWNSRSRESSRPYKSKRRAALEWLSEALLPRAFAEEICEKKIIGYRDRTVEETRFQTMVDTCEWEEDRVETRECSVEPVSFSAEFMKPEAYDPDWQPGGASYHHLLPNKYDLLPGEWEDYSILINPRTKDSQVRTSFDVGNAWNAYQVSAPQFTCAKNQPLNINLKIKTAHRIVRRAPNALDQVTDRLGQGRGIQADVAYVGATGQPVAGRPYRLQLTDRSNETMLVAARQSRKFADLDPSATVTVMPTTTHAASARELGFVKNTLLRIKIIEMGGCFGEGEKVFADVLHTTSDYTKAEGDTLLVPLDGSQPGVPTFYRPFGFVGRLLGQFGPLDLKLNPGLAYEFRIAMLQQGLPFYLNGCRDGRPNCGEADANPRMYSEELKIRFTADPNRDDRAWWQRFEHWYGKKWWNKFRSCAGAS